MIASVLASDMSDSDKVMAIGGLLGQLGGGALGALAGGTLGSLGGPLGIIAGSFGGGALGALLGDKLGTSIAEWIMGMPISAEKNLPAWVKRLYGGGSEPNKGVRVELTPSAGPVPMSFGAELNNLAGSYMNTLRGGIGPGTTYAPIDASSTNIDQSQAALITLPEHIGSSNPNAAAYSR